MLRRRSVAGLLVLCCLPAFVLGLVEGARGASLRPADVFGRVLYRSYPHSAVAVRGRVLDGSGRPTSTLVTVTAFPLAGGPVYSWSRSSGWTGHYAVYVPRGPSRTLVVTAAGAVEVIRENVSPGLWLKVHAKRRGRLVFSGGLLVPRGTWPLPTAVIEDRTPSGWRIFAAANANAQSHWFRYVYRTDPRSRGFRFAFRIATVPQYGWLSGTSRPKFARVR